MDKFPHTTNQDIALKFNTYNANSVKTYRIQWLKKNSGKVVPPDKTVRTAEEKIQELVKDAPHYTKVDADTIEDVLLVLVNTGRYDAGLLRCMIDFQIKIKGKIDEIEDNIDMEALREIGITSTSRS